MDQCMYVGCKDESSDDSCLCHEHEKEAFLHWVANGVEDSFGQTSILAFLQSRFGRRLLASGRFLSISRAADLLGVKPGRLLGWARAGKITILRLKGPRSLTYFLVVEITRLKSFLEDKITLRELSEQPELAGIPRSRIDRLINDLRIVPSEWAFWGKDRVIDRSLIPEFVRLEAELRATENQRRVETKKKKSGNGFSPRYLAREILGRIYSDSQLKNFASKGLLPCLKRKGCYLFRVNGELIRAFRAISRRNYQPRYQMKAMKAAAKLAAYLQQQGR